MKFKYDFSGWATKNNLRCTDGRVIKKNAFAHNDGTIVPLVFMHGHSDVSNVIGNALLENREEGVYAYCSLNDSENGKNAKIAVRHGDLNQLSICANHLTQQGTAVLHGDIKELSLVLSGANPGAIIDNRYEIMHSDGSIEENEDDSSAVIMTGALINTVKHGDMYFDAGEPEDDDDLEDGEDGDEGEEFEIEHAEGSTVAEIFDTLNDEQREAVYAVLEEALSDEEEDDDDEGDETDDDDEIAQSDIDEGGEMKYNVFEQMAAQGPVISHDDMSTVLADAKKYGSLKDSIMAHMEDGVLMHAVTNDDGSTQTYGIANINYLFPDARTITNTPDFIQREQAWVSKVMNGTRHTPFTRIKSVHADITMDEARALGYMKGNLKKEEVFTLLKRTTDPQTIYKKQKLDRDDIIDITDFDVVVWLKQEMRIMLDEEIARAILVGDGRSTSSDDKIQESHVRPIYTDADLYAMKYQIPVASTDDADTRAKAFIRKVKKSFKDYKGSGNPTLFIDEDLLSDLLLLEDGIGHILYDDVNKLATALRVKEIISVPVMEGLTRTVTDGTSAKTYALGGIVVNLNDYNVGCDKGGSVSFFDDFDIDYNQQKYLIETRISGALVKPKSAMVFEFDSSMSTSGGSGSGD